MKTIFSSPFCVRAFPASTRTNCLRLGLGCALLLTGCAKAPETVTPVVAAEDQVEQLYPGQSGTPVTVNLHGKSLTYERLNGQNILQGDIMLTDEEVDPNRPATESAFRDSGRWPAGVVYYTIDDNFTNPDRVHLAMENWRINTKSIILFLPRHEQADYVTFQNSTGNGSKIGRRGGQQFVNLARTAPVGTVIHEIGHVLGLYHEQCRQDRDDHITVHYENIVPDEQHNFDKYGPLLGTDIGAFDFGSIMLYGSSAFSKNGNPTITKKDGSVFRMQRRSLSEGDKSTIMAEYRFFR